eukprot:m.176459 g.176459  ORF g.176459 m.176459 type:complete len:112 (+) comp14899_c0_seq8:1726-2061(+)
MLTCTRYNSLAEKVRMPRNRQVPDGRSGASSRRTLGNSEDYKERHSQFWFDKEKSDYLTSARLQNIDRPLDSTAHFITVNTAYLLPFSVLRDRCVLDLMKFITPRTCQRLL